MYQGSKVWIFPTKQGVGYAPYRPHSRPHCVESSSLDSWLFVDFTPQFVCKSVLETQGLFDKLPSCFVGLAAVISIERVAPCIL